MSARAASTRKSPSPETSALLSRVRTGVSEYRAKHPRMTEKQALFGLVRESSIGTLLAHRLEIGKECVTQTFVRPTLVERETVRTLEPVARPKAAAAALYFDPQPA